MLTTYAVEKTDDDISSHIASCPSCSRYVKEMRIIRESLETLPDEKAPDKLHGDILKTIKDKNSLSDSWLNFIWTNWFKNPFIIGIGIVWAIIFIYIFLVFVL
jgi:hypothetical protein